MGWTSHYIDAHDKTIDVVREEYTQTPTDTRAGFEWVYLTMHSSTAYGVQKVTPPGQPPRWFGMVVLTSRKTLGRGVVEISLKAMDESVMPYYYDAPPKMLDMLDRLAFYDSEDAVRNAMQWRAECRRHHACRKAARDAVHPGQLIEIGGERYLVERKQPGRMGYTISHAVSGKLYRLPLNQIKHAKQVKA